MESILASSAFLVRRLHVGGDYGAADGTLALSFQSSLYIPPECHQSVHEVSVGKQDHALDHQKPALPFLLVNGYAGASTNSGLMQWVRWGKGYSNRCRW